MKIKRRALIYALFSVAYSIVALTNIRTILAWHDAFIQYSSLGEAYVAPRDAALRSEMISVGFSVLIAQLAIIAAIFARPIYMKAQATS